MTHVSPSAVSPTSGESATAPHAGEPALRAIFPALAQLLGADDFGALARAACVAADAAAATGSCAAVDPSREDLPRVQPGALVHGLLVRRGACADDRIPSRLAADIAALEWTIHAVAGRAPTQDSDRRASPLELHASDGGEPRQSAWRDAVLAPLRAFDIVPVAFRLESWVRRVHEGRRTASLPSRGEQHIVVSARRPLQAPAEPATAGADSGPAGLAPDELPDPRLIPLDPVWWFALPPGQGELLCSLALGTPAGAAVRRALARGWLDDEAAGLALVEAWLREGLFTDVRHPTHAS